MASCRMMLLYKHSDGGVIKIYTRTHLFEAQEVHPVHRKTVRATTLDHPAGDSVQPRLRGRTCTGTLREDESQLLRQDEARRHDESDVVEKLCATWSSEQIARRLFNGIIAFSTIYRWTYAVRIDVPMTLLHQKAKRRKPLETRGLVNVMMTFSNR